MRPLRVGVDARSLEEQRTGIGRYLHNLLREAVLLRPTWRFLAYTIGPPPADLPPGVEPRRVSFESVDQSDLFEAELRRDPPDVFFSPLYDLPRPIAVPCLITVHDMVHEATPEAFTDVQLAYLRERHAYSLRRADRVITDSEFARGEIVSRFPDVNPIVIPLAGDPRFRPSFLGSAPDNPCILYVASIARTRHLAELARAFLASDRLRESVHQLRVVGRNHLPDPAPLEALLADPRIDRREWVLDESLISLYQQAGAFAYLSTYEGFGMPPLEAMACGVPVLAARAASIPEVVGDAALLVDDPRDLEAVRDALERIALDDSLRRVLIQRGYARAAQFTWRDTARRTLEVLSAASRR